MTVSVFNIAVGGDDGHTYQEGVGYPPAGAITVEDTATEVVARKSLSGGTYYVGPGLMRWDTSTLGPSANITSALLRIDVVAKNDNDGRSLTLEWYVHDGSISSADHTNTVGTDAHAGTALSLISVAADQEFALLNPDSNINKTGYSGLRGHLSGADPTLPNNAQWAALEHASSVEARLVVTHTSAFGPFSASLAVGCVPTTARLLAYDRNVSLVVGCVVAATRTLGYARAASTMAVGCVVAATRVLGFSRTASLAVGLVESATRGAVTYARSVSLAVGLLPFATIWTKIKRVIATTGTNRDVATAGTNRDAATTGTNRDIESW